MFEQSALVSNFFIISQLLDTKFHGNFFIGLIGSWERVEFGMCFVRVSVFAEIVLQLVEHSLFPRLVCATTCLLRRPSLLCLRTLSMDSRTLCSCWALAPSFHGCGSVYVACVC